MSTVRLSSYSVHLPSLIMWNLLVFVSVSTAIASPAPRLPGYTYRQPRYSTGNEVGSQVPTTLGDMIKESCERNGEASSFINFIETRDQFKRNFIANAIIQAMVLVEKGEYRDRVKLICRLKSTIKTGFVNMTNALRPCVRDEDRQKLDRVSEIIDSLLNYACYNEGHKFSSFINEGGVQCLQEHNLNISGCASKLFGDRIEPLNSQELTNEIHSYEPFTKDGKEQKKRHECQALVDLKTCVKNEIDQCPNSSSSTFVTGVLDSIITPFCQDY